MQVATLWEAPGTYEARQQAGENRQQAIESVCGSASAEHALFASKRSLVRRGAEAGSAVVGRSEGRIATDREQSFFYNCPLLKHRVCSSLAISASTHHVGDEAADHCERGGAPKARGGHPHDPRCRPIRRAILARRYIMRRHSMRQAHPTSTCRFSWAPAERELTLARSVPGAAALRQERLRYRAGWRCRRCSRRYRRYCILAQTVERMVEIRGRYPPPWTRSWSPRRRQPQFRYGWLLYERAAALRAAEHAGINVYVTGQSWARCSAPRTRRSWACAPPFGDGARRSSLAVP